jgi:hypothetical protein
VLIDIGASGGLHNEWKRIAKYSVCIAFDGDDREMGVTSASGGSFKQLHVFHSLVSDTAEPETNFNLTASPFCSSTLKPDEAALEPWAFANLFKVEKIVRQKCVTLQHVLDSLKIGRIDWFKTDAQGIDLRLFKSLPEPVRERVLVADFEPGIIEVYTGEDKLPDLLKFMEGTAFWLSDLRLDGTQRMRRADVEKYFGPGESRRFRYGLKKSPCYGEASYINSLRNAELFSKRDLMLAYVLATVKRQYGFAYEIAGTGRKRFQDEIFAAMADEAIGAMKIGFPKLALHALYRAVNKLFRMAGVGEVRQ